MALTLIRAQEQRADFRLAGHFVVEEQGRDLSTDSQVCRGVDRQPDTVVVPGLTQPDGTCQGTDADHLLIVVFEHEQVVGVRPFYLPDKGPLCPAYAQGQTLLV